MSALNRRTLMACLAAVATGPVLAAANGPALAAAPYGLPGLDAAAASRIGKAYLASRPMGRGALERDLFPRGLADVASLRGRVAADFRRGRMFVHEGWRLSDTEGRLFALWSLAGR